MNIPSAWSQVLDFFGTPLVIEPSPGQLSGDAGLLPIRLFDQRIGLTRANACALDDSRDPDRSNSASDVTYRLRRISCAGTSSNCCMKSFLQESNLIRLKGGHQLPKPQIVGWVLNVAYSGRTHRM
jgi:hypothetical protein